MSVSAQSQRSSNGMAPSTAHAAIVPGIVIHAFWKESALRDTLQIAAGDRRMARADLTIAQGGVAQAIARYESQPAPDLLIIEVDDDLDALVHALERLAEHCPANTQLILVGARNDVDFYRELIARGVSDYVLAGQDASTFIRSIARLYAAHEKGRVGRIILFMGATGGAGSSTLAQNVAASLAATQKAKTILLDLDLAFGSAALNTNVGDAQGAAQALQAGERLDQVLLERVLVERNAHLSLLAAPASPSTYREPDEENVLRLVDVAASLSPNLVIDAPHCWSSTTARLAHLADECVIVAEPTILGLRNAKALVEVMSERRVNDTPPRYVLNKNGMKGRKEIGVKAFAQTLSAPPFAIVDHLPARFSTAENEGVLLVETGRRSQAFDAINALAVSLSGRAARRRAGIFSRVAHVLRR